MDRTIKIVAAVLAVVVVASIVVLIPGLSVSQKDNGTTDTGTIYFFYGEECPHCHTIMPFVINMTEKYPDANIRILEVWHNQTNHQIWVQVSTAAGISYYGVPEVISGTTVLYGEKEIPEKFEGLIQNDLKKKS